MQKLGLALVLISALAATACSKANKDDCKAAGDNVAKIMGIQGELAKGVTDKFVEECDGKIKKSEAKCVADAKSMEDVKGCDGK